MEWYMDYVCTLVPHLYLVDIDQNMSTTAKLIVSCNPVKKIKLLNATAPYILGNVSCFCPGKKIFILTLHTLRQSLD